MNKTVTPPTDIARAVETVPPALLFEMIRSFVAMARTLNLSHAVKELNSTRQTVRRHITALEELKGGALFDVRERRYALSPLGERVLPEAKELQANATAWISGQAEKVNGLQYLSHQSGDGSFFYQQQHQVDRVFSSTGTMLQDVIKGWSLAGGQLEHEALKSVRPFCNIFRRAQGELVFTEVGEDSSFVSWFGSALAQSTIGRTMGQMPGGDVFEHLMNMAYSEIERSQAIRLDHIHTIMAKEGSDVPVPIAYERLMLGARYPDQSPAIISVVRRTYDVKIRDVTSAMVRRMPEEALM